MSKKKKILVFSLVLFLLLGTFPNLKPLKFELGWNETEPMALETEETYNE